MHKSEDVARIIKKDIIECMRSGQLQLLVSMGSDSQSTKKARRLAGLGEEPRFLATEQLIDSLQLYVNIRGNKQWKTRQGILV